MSTAGRSQLELTRGLTPDEKRAQGACQQCRDLELALACRSLRTAPGITSGADAAAFLETKEHRK